MQNGEDQENTFGNPRRLAKPSWKRKSGLPNQLQQQQQPQTPEQGRIEPALPQAAQQGIEIIGLEIPLIPIGRLHTFLIKGRRISEVQVELKNKDDASRQDVHCEDVPDGVQASFLLYVPGKYELFMTVGTEILPMILLTGISNPNMTEDLQDSCTRIMILLQRQEDKIQSLRSAAAAVLTTKNEVEAAVQSMQGALNAMNLQCPRNMKIPPMDSTLNR